MRYPFLSDEWFARVDELIAQAGDLEIPEPMRNVEANVTVVSGGDETHLHVKDGVFYRGHQQGLGTTITLDAQLARRIFVDGDVTAGVQGYLEGQIQVTGDLASVVKLQTTMPSEPQKQLTRQIAEITA